MTADTDTPATLTPEEVESLFTRSDGSYLFARWGRAIAPIVFGVQDETLAVVREAVQGVCALAGHEMTEMDAELGSNLMFFFFRNWAELPEVPGMDRLVPELDDLVARLSEAQANQYRLYRFDPQGAIKACFVFIRMDENLQAVPAQTLALSQAVQSILLWSDRAFTDRSPLKVATGETTVLRPDIAALIRAAYDPVMPVCAQDPAHALRLSARLTRPV